MAIVAGLLFHCLKLTLVVHVMHLSHIAELLGPFLSAPLSDAQLAQLAAYLEILHRWNARINLTAVRGPEQIVTRHFGESLFAAQCLCPSGLASPGSYLVDIGSGAGFPGLPIKIWATGLSVTLIESQNKKAVFLKEVIRALDLKDIKVATTRAEDVPISRPDDLNRKPVITLRAVEKFERILPVAAQLAAGGRLALLIGSLQVRAAQAALPGFAWSDPLPIPQSLSRVLLVGHDPR